MLAGVGAVLLIASTFAGSCGCSTNGTPDDSAVTTIGPHGGTVVRMPDRLGLAEITVRDGPKSARGTRILTVYFLPEATQPSAGATAPAGAGPIAPEEARIELAMPGNAAPLLLPLTRDPQSGVVGSEVRFSSRPNPIELDQMIGILSGNVGDHPFRVSFRTR